MFILCQENAILIEGISPKRQNKVGPHHVSCATLILLTGNQICFFDLSVKNKRACG